MPKYTINLPKDFVDYAWEVQVKGWFSGASIVCGTKRYQLNFFDPTRLSQEIKDELDHKNFFFEPNLIIVKEVTQAAIEEAITALVERGYLNSLKEDPSDGT